MKENDGSIFDQFTEFFKIDEEDKLYSELRSVPIRFDASQIKLEDPDDFQNLIEEMNNVSPLIFRYKMMLANQSKIVQKIDDGYTLWRAKKWVEYDGEQEPKFDRSGQITGYKKVDRTGTAIEQYIIANNPEEYNHFRNLVKNENYKLTIIKAAVSSIEGYSFKLHAILNYKQNLEVKGL